MPAGLSGSERRQLLQIARRTLEEYLSTRTLVSVTPSSPLLSEKRGAFVTLEKNGVLRGCIGWMVADRPLFLAVQEMAIQAATGDPRFPPVTAAELNDLEIEISVLSPLHRISDVSEIEVGGHGLVVSQGGRRGVLLPQVAVRENWDRETFLRSTCLKAGLPADAWKGSGVTIETFSAEVFGEKSGEEKEPVGR